jgi:hypothetical protein
VLFFGFIFLVFQKGKIFSNEHSTIPPFIHRRHVLNICRAEGKTESLIIRGRSTKTERGVRS